MKTGKVTAKLRDRVIINLYDNGVFAADYVNIELPDEIKDLEFRNFITSFEDEKITFTFDYAEGILPTTFPAPKALKHRAKKTEAKAEGIIQEPEIIEEPEIKICENDGIMTVDFEGDRKALVAEVCNITGMASKYLAAPSMAYDIGGEYKVTRFGSLMGPTNKDLVKELTERGFKIAE